MFAARCGPANVARSHPAYDARMYWRAAAWPQLNYLLWLAVRRWNPDSEADRLAAVPRETAAASTWAEDGDPETGDGLGAAPQSWTTLVVAMDGPSGGLRTAARTTPSTCGTWNRHPARHPLNGHHLLTVTESAGTPVAVTNDPQSDPPSEPRATVRTWDLPALIS